MDYDINKLHKVQQEILDYAVKVCEENNLVYFLAFGTALGAYRHRGFIPWDDDVDIMMPRGDYEKLREILHTHNDSVYSIQDEKNEPNYFLTFFKIRKNGTVFIEEIADDIYSNNGIYIDVFPLDNVDNKSPLGVKANNFIISYWRHALRFKACKELYRKKESDISYFIDSLVTLPTKLFDNKTILRHIAKKMIGNALDDSKYLAQYNEPPEKAIIDRVICFPPSKLEFEGKMYNAPNDICEYLKSQYGDDYMILPPVEQRYTHSPIELKF